MFVYNKIDLEIITSGDVNFKDGVLLHTINNNLN